MGAAANWPVRPEDCTASTTHTEMLPDCLHQTVNDKNKGSSPVLVCCQDENMIKHGGIWLSGHACMWKVAGSSPSGGSESTFRSDLLLTARGGNTCTFIVIACLHTLLSVPTAAWKGWVLY
jgi:hypothetical protein